MSQLPVKVCQSEGVGGVRSNGCSTPVSVYSGDSSYDVPHQWSCISTSTTMFKILIQISQPDNSLFYKPTNPQQSINQIFSIYQKLQYMYIVMYKYMWICFVSP